MMVQPFIDLDTQNRYNQHRDKFKLNHAEAIKGTQQWTFYDITEKMEEILSDNYNALKLSELPRDPEATEAFDLYLIDDMATTYSIPGSEQYAREHKFVQAIKNNLQYIPYTDMIRFVNEIVSMHSNEIEFYEGR